MAGALLVTCLALELETRPQWYPPGLRRRPQQRPRSTSNFS